MKKLGRVPEGGGKRMAPGFAEMRSGPHSRRSLGLEYLHVAVDDHSRYAYVSVLPDERGAGVEVWPTTAAGSRSMPRTTSAISSRSRWKTWPTTTLPPASTVVKP